MIIYPHIPFFEKNENQTNLMLTIEKFNQILNYMRYIYK